MVELKNLLLSLLILVWFTGFVVWIIGVNQIKAGTINAHTLFWIIFIIGGIGGSLLAAYFGGP